MQTQMCPHRRHRKFCIHACATALHANSLSAPPPRKSGVVSFLCPAVNLFTIDEFDPYGKIREFNSAFVRHALHANSAWSRFCADRG